MSTATADGPAVPVGATTYNGPACCRYCRDGDEFVRAWSIVSHLIETHPGRVL